MMRRRLLILGAILAGIAVAGLAPPARADFILTISEGSTSVTIDQATSGSTAPNVTGSLGGGAAVANGHGFTLVNVTVGDYNISTQAATNNIPGTTLGFINLQNTTITLQSQNAPTTALTLSLATTTASGYGGYYAPGNGPGVMESTVAGQGVGSVGFTATYQSYLSNSVVGPQQVAVGNLGNGYNPGNLTQYTPVTVTTPYTLQSVMTLQFASSDPANSQVSNLEGTTQVLAPAPPGIVMAMSAFPLLGTGAWLRRRRLRAGS